MTNDNRPVRTRTVRSALSAFADVIGGAGACAVAAKTGRAPSERALKAVGIEAEAWNRIVRR